MLSAMFKQNLILASPCFAKTWFSCLTNFLCWGELVKQNRNMKQRYCSAAFHITPFYTSPRWVYPVPTALHVREELVWFFSYPSAMPRRRFSLSKYTEQWKCNLKPRNPSGSLRRESVSLLYSACPLSTVTQTDRQHRKAREKQEVPNPTWRRGT